MRETDFDFQNILVIKFGQLGDVVLSLPALKAIRERFPRSRITLLIGKPGADVVRIANVSDEQILVDRVELRDGNKLRSIAKILKLAKNIRGRKFDLVIDLHSLSETNILGFVSGARRRLYANRENRSLDWLSRFPVRPPKEDKSKHYTDRYFDVLSPLGIPPFGGEFQIGPPNDASAEIDTLFNELGITDRQLVGFFIGAGHPSRCWSLENFAEAAGRISAQSGKTVLVFLGPEERHLLDRVREIFPPEAIILDKLKLLPLMAAAARLEVLVTNDTGPMHLAAVAGSPIVLILDSRAPACFFPLTRRLRVLNQTTIEEITVDEVIAAVNDLSAEAMSK
ncbi:lipopolysaccharide heptosyltransferase II [soil metagenome]